MDRRAATGRPLTAGEPRPPTADARRRPPAGDLGLFGPDSLTWRLDREAFLLLGAGPRALLLQLAHPAVAAGVADHSSFRADPWGRLAGTLRSYLRIVYGTTVAARTEIHRLNALHESVRGKLPGGGSYRARDPELALWVHATLVDSTLATANAWLGPLSQLERARAYAESVPVGRAFGLPPALLPADVDAFDAYVATMLGREGPVRPGELARELATVVLHPPPGPAIRTLVEGLPAGFPSPLRSAAAAAGDRLSPAAVAWLLWPAVGLLPASVRDEYGLAWGPIERAVSAWLVGSWRRWNGVLPASVRAMPQARVADRRISAGPAWPGGAGAQG